MKKYKLYLIDLDGTVYNGNEGIKYSKEFISYLNEHNIDYLFLTNNSRKAKSMIIEKLDKLGIKTFEENIFTSSEATAIYLKENNLKNVYLIGEKGLKNTLVSNDINITEDNPNAVVVGLDTKITYEKFAIACKNILNGSKFIATNPDNLIPTESGMYPGNGAQVKYLEFATSKEALVIGKPNSLIIDLAIKRFNYDKKEIVMIGDNYNTDILSGINANIDTIHVQTGVTSKDELIAKKIQPTYTIKNLKELLDNI